MEGKYEYEFFCWPDETTVRNPAVYKLFEQLRVRQVMELTALEFVRFRLDLNQFGITLREVTRRPATEPEIVL